MKHPLATFITLILLAANAFAADPLPSWKGSAPKQAVVAFVEKVTKAGSADFLPPEQRIAVFDNDGTLWAEQPAYFQLLFAIDRIKAMSKDHPEWAGLEPYKSVLAGDMHALGSQGKEALLQILATTHAGMTTEEFAASVKAWLESARHPTTGRPYTEMVYQPMLEMLAYLRANDFKTFIVSGGGVEFMRVFAEQTYGIPPEQVVGSSGVVTFEVRDGKATLTKEPKIEFIDDGPGKPVGINRFIGRRPVIAFGNSDGDFQMLEYTTGGSGPRMAVLIHHDDAEREYAYDRDSHIGKLARGLDEAAGRGWVVVSMKDHWLRIFPDTRTEAEARQIATEAYIYLYPLISMELTRKLTTNVPAGVRQGLGPMNDFHHFREFPDANFREVVRPNFDTLYSSAWLDLTREPVVISAADTAGRYYLLPLLDMWSDVFAVPGKRTSGTTEASWLIAPPGWSGEVPDGLSRIDSPTRYVWLIGRTQTNGPADYEAVHAVQAGYRVTPLSEWGKATTAEPTFVPDPSVDMKTPPLNQVNNMPGLAYFSLGAELMALHPPHVTDWSIIERMKRLGIEPGKPLDAANLDPVVRAALEAAPAEGLKLMQSKLPTLARVVNGWQMNTDSMGVYGNYYLKRAIVAMVGLGANQPEDAIYPMAVHDADGQPLKGEHRYVLHFPKDQMPPVDAFWSITMYDHEGFQVANELNRFAIGDRDQLTFNADGSLDIHIQAESPGADKESNWLPSPSSGLLGVTMRLYSPQPQALDGRWDPPAVKKVTP
jgi:phosphoglycolate phosphatase-like HAD superfamily hydrolase